MIKIVSLRGGARLLAIAVSFFLIVPIPGLAQAKTSLAGTVIDDSGAVIPDASVAATNDETHQVYSVKTDGVGHYQIPDLPFGKYTVRASVTGFKTAERDGVALNPGAAIQLNFTIPIGDGPVGGIHIKIQTSNGAYVAGATIDVSAVTTGATWHGTSDSNGEYQFPDMPCVDYDVQVSASNGKHSKRRIHVNAGASQVTRIVLQ